MTKGIVFIKRYGPPGNLDTAPHGTICQVDNECDFDIYVQVSHDQESPKWRVMNTYPQKTPLEKIAQEAENFKKLKF